MRIMKYLLRRRSTPILAPHVHARLQVETVVGFESRKRNLRPVREASSNIQLPLRAAGVHLTVRSAAWDARTRPISSCARERSALPHAVRPALEVQVLHARRLQVSPRLLRHAADGEAHPGRVTQHVVPGHERLGHGVRPRESGGDFSRAVSNCRRISPAGRTRSLPRPPGSRRPGAHVAAVGLRQPPRLDGVVHGLPSFLPLGAAGCGAPVPVCGGARVGVALIVIVDLVGLWYHRWRTGGLPPGPRRSVRGLPMSPPCRRYMIGERQ